MSKNDINKIAVFDYPVIINSRLKATTIKNVIHIVFFLPYNGLSIIGITKKKQVNSQMFMTIKARYFISYEVA